MKKFNFELEKVLKIKAWKENEAKIELGRSVSYLSSIEKSIEEIAVKRNEASKKNINDFIDFNNYRVQADYISRLDFEKEKLLQDAAAAELQVEKDRQIWTEAKADLKSLENLKENRFKDYRKNMFAQEEKEMSDLHREKGK
jgi:flagellar FliJ protein